MRAPLRTLLVAVVGAVEDVSLVEDTHLGELVGHGQNHVIYTQKTGLPKQQACAHHAASTEACKQQT